MSTTVAPFLSLERPRFFLLAICKSSSSPTTSLINERENRETIEEMHLIAYFFPRINNVLNFIEPSLFWRITHKIFYRFSNIWVRVSFRWLNNRNLKKRGREKWGRQLWKVLFLVQFFRFRSSLNFSFRLFTRFSYRFSLEGK